MQHSRQLFQRFFCMPVTVFIFGHITVMRVRMRDCVRMRCAVVCMRKAVLMHMFVLPDPCVDHNERRAACHHDQSDDISTPAFFWCFGTLKTKNRASKQPIDRSEALFCLIFPCFFLKCRKTPFAMADKRRFFYGGDMGT